MGIQEPSWNSGRVGIDRVVHPLPHPVLEHFCYPKKFPHPHLQSVPILSPDPVTCNPLFVFIHLHSPEVFIYMKSYNESSFVPGFFDLAWGFWGQSLLLHLPALCSFLLHSTIPLCGYSHSVYLFTSWWIFFLFPVLAAMNNISMNISIQVFVWTYIFIFLGWMPRSRIAELYSKLMFNF